MTLDEYRKNSSNKNSKLGSFINKVLISIILVLLILIFCNQNENFKNKVKELLFFNTIDFSFINNFSNKISDIFKINETLNVGDFDFEKLVSDYKDGVMIKSNDHDIKNIYSGIVTYIGENEDYGYTVIIQGSNGYDIWYGNLDNTDLKIYDYVEDGILVGSFTDKYYLVIQKDGKYVSYDKINK